jgi:hypothetical protein
MADNLVFEESLNSEIDPSEFVSKKWVYVNDRNTQNYQTQIIIDTTPLSNAGGWVNWSEGFIVMPLVVQLQSTETPANLPYPPTSVADYSWGFKSGFWQMIHSMTVEFNNGNIVSQTPFLNVFRSFKANTSFSQDDLKNEGASIGFYPDTADSWGWENTFCADGAGGAGGESVISQIPAIGRGINIPYTNNSNALNNNPVFSTSTLDGNLAFGVLPTGLPSIPATNTAGSPVITVITAAGAGQPAIATVAYTGNPVNPEDLPFQYYKPNTGFLERQKYNNYNGSTETQYSYGQSFINPSQQALQACRSGLDTAQSVEGSYVWQVFAKLRLKDLNEFFERCPLLKGSTMRFYINTNQSTINFQVGQVLNGSNDGGGNITNLENIAQVISTTATDAATPNTPVGTVNTYNVLNINSVSNTGGGGTNPLMIADAGFGQGCSTLKNGSYTLSVNIVTNPTTGAKTSLTSTRLYAPLYAFTATAETRYLSTVQTKKIMYKDIIQFTVPNIPAGRTFSTLVTNGLSNLMSVLVCPFISASQVYNENNAYVPFIDTNTAPDIVTTFPYNSFLNPCVSSPAHPDPVLLTNFNVVISGTNLFLNNENYDFEAFREQLLQSNQLNGSLTTGLASGLVSEYDFSNLYRYYYGDCSRTLPNEENVPRSIQLNGQNESTMNVDLMVFCEYMREITIDINTGARVG